MKIIVFIFLFFLISVSAFSQNSYTVIVDSTIFGIRDFYSIKTPGTNLKDIYIQEGMTQGPFGLVGGRYYKINDQRTGRIVIPFLGPVNCSNGNYNPIGHIARSKSNPNVYIFNGIFTCGGISGDFNKLTRDGGQTVIDLPFGGGNNGQQSCGFEIHPTDDNIMFMIHSRYNEFQFNDPRLFKSTNGGFNWFIIDTLYNAKVLSEPWGSSESFGGFFNICSWSPNQVLANDYTNIMLSSNGGYQFFGLGNIRNIKFSFFDEGRLSKNAISNNKMFVTYGNTVWDHWYEYPLPFNATCAEVDLYNTSNNRTIYAGSANGLYKTTNSGVSWFLYQNFSPSSNKIVGISKDYFGGDTLIVATDQKVYKLWKTLTNLTGEINSPGSFELKQNYPNPFNPSTSIQFSLPSKTFLTIKVYDIRGNEVRLLASGFYNPGTYAVNFNASGLASGIYYYKLDSETFRDKKKMMLIK